MSDHSAQEARQASGRFEHMNNHEMLRRLLKAKDEAEPQGEMTAGRVVRLAIARAADETLGLALTVLGVNIETEGLDPVVKRLAGDWMLLGLLRGDEVVGIAGLDLQARAAAIEMQTLGQLRGTPANERAITPSDVALCAPLITSLLAEMEDASVDMDLAGWTTGAHVGARIINDRAVGLALAETRYRFVQMTLDLGVEDRQGTVLLALPVSPAKTKEADTGVSKTDSFSANFQATVMEAPAILHAVLHQMSLPLSKVAGFQVGDMLPLPGVTVGSVRIEGAGGQVLGRARLGQVTGMRAVRLEVADPAQLTEVRMPERHKPAAPRVGNAAALGKAQVAPAPADIVTADTAETDG